MKAIAITLLSLFMLGCAYSPQQITVNPRVPIDDSSYGNGGSLQVTAVDERQQKVLGSRGGIYQNTSTITLANDMPEAIVRAAKAKLATQGFNVNSETADATLNIVMEELRYELPESTVKEVSTLCVMRVEVQAGTESFTGKYRTENTRKNVFTPTMARNEKMVNDLISDTMARAFSDPKLIAFLSNI